MPPFREPSPERIRRRPRPHRLTPVVLRLLALGASTLLPACSGPSSTAGGGAGTPDLREALFDSILARTARRTAFSQPKQEALRFDPLAEMAALRSEVVGADSEEKLFYALLRLSNARRDRHLSVALVPGGIRPPFTDGLPVWEGPPTSNPAVAPVRLLPDFETTTPAFFVADIAEGATPAGLALGDRVVSVNGLTPAELEDSLRLFIRHSSVAGFRWKLAEALTQRTALLPPEFRGEHLTIEVRRADGTTATERLPYFRAEDLRWSGASDPSYPGFALEWSTPTFDLYLPTHGQRIVILQWHRFSSSLLEDVDRLVTFAEEQALLDHALIVDATRSGGGSLGAYAVQRIQPRPFKTTFGTLRLSDVIRPFVEEKRAQFRARRVNDSGGPETVDDGTWLMSWLEEDVLEALGRGDSVTAPVPFKLAHAPKDSDGILPPAPVHFRGPLVVFSSPFGGSHLDQFMSIVADNDLGPIFGMPAGGYSNTWEWEEVLTFPGTDQPVVGFMWNIGHTIRPNGEVLEGNPAPVDYWIPLTAGNFREYYRILYDQALRYLRGVGFMVGP